jgi:hypothetical protein
VPQSPEPPAPGALAAIGAAWYGLSVGTQLWRVFFRGTDHPATWNAFRTYGPVDARFDHHRPPACEQERGILYAATSPATCLAEVFQATRRIDVRLNEPWLVGFATTRPLRLLHLTGMWPTRVGASMAINTGPRARARRWSRGFYETIRDADGLVYASSMHTNLPALALYERAGDALPPTPFMHRGLADPLLRVVLENAAAELGYDVIV